MTAPFQAAAGMAIGTSLAAFLISHDLYALHQTPLDASGLPQGVGQTFFIGLKSNDAIFAYLPMEMIGEYSDDALARRWQKYPPDLVVVLRQDLSGLGFRGFGIDYGTQSSSWISSNYIPLTDPNGPAIVLAKRPSDVR